jgi:hypothetical protein
LTIDAHSVIALSLTDEKNREEKQDPRAEYMPLVELQRNVNLRPLDLLCKGGRVVYWLTPRFNWF